MAMGVNGVNPGLNALNRAQRAQQNTIQKIATGSNYPSAANGASQYAITQRMYNNIGSIGQSIQNTQNVNAMLQTASGAASNTVQALSTIRENIINAANGTNNSSDRSNLQDMVNQMVRQIDDNAGVTYNGQRLLDGSRNITVAGITGYENVSVGNLTSRGLGLTDEQGNVTIDLSTEESTQAALDTIGSAIDTAQGSVDTLSAAQTNNSFDAALDELTTLGAQQQRLDYQADLYTTMEENELNAVSTINDADIAKEITNLRSQQTQEQLAMFATRMYNQNRANVLNLLQ